MDALDCRLVAGDIGGGGGASVRACAPSAALGMCSVSTGRDLTPHATAMTIAATTAPRATRRIHRRGSRRTVTFGPSSVRCTTSVVERRRYGCADTTGWASPFHAEK